MFHAPRFRARLPKLWTRLNALTKARAQGKNDETQKCCRHDRDSIDDTYSQEPVATEFAPAPKPEWMAGNIQCQQCSNQLDRSFLSIAWNEWAFVRVLPCSRRGLDSFCLGNTTTFSSHPRLGSNLSHQRRFQL